MEKLKSYLEQASKLISEGNYQKAIMFLNDVNVANPSFLSFSERGIAYFHLKQYKKAEIDLSKAFAYREDDERRLLETGKLRSECLVHLGRPREALMALQSLTEDLTETELLTEVYEMLEALQKHMPKEDEEFLELYRQNIEVKLGDAWHVVSCEWFDKWLSFAGLTSSQTSHDLPFALPGASSPMPPGPIDNQNLVEKKVEGFKPSANVVLKYGLQENQDFVLLPDPAFLHLKALHGCTSDIVRWAIEVNDSMYQIEVFLRPVTVLYFKSSLQEIRLQVSRKDSISVVKTQLTKLRQLSSKLRLWKVSAEALQKERLALFCKHTHSVFFSGTLLKDDLLVDDSELAPDDCLFAEQAQSDQFFFTEDFGVADTLCKYCQAAKHLKVVCPLCKRARYCSSYCREKHAVEHSAMCKRPRKSLLRWFSQLWQCCGHSSKQDSSSSDEEQISLAISKPRPKVKHGLVGLHNLGNTCFMNSALQCLSFTTELTQYFIDESFKSDINKTNPLGSKGKLVAAYYDLLVNLWSGAGAGSAYAPWKFKKVLSQVAPRFQGYQQHDSHELLSCLVDILHEDLNLVLKKPYQEQEVNTEGKTDEVAAQMFWERHLARNRSVVVDLMHGQFKSTLTCPRCSSSFCTFDTFSSLSLPIPTTVYKTVHLYFVYRDSHIAPVCLSLEGDFHQLKDLKETLNSALKLGSTCFAYAAVSDGMIFQMLDVGETLASIKKYSLFAFEVTESEIQKIPVELQFCVANSTKLYGYPRLVFLKDTQSFKDLHLKIFRKLQAYIQDQEEADEEKYQQQPKPFYHLVFKTDRFTRCALCEKKLCKGCPVPYNDDLVKEVLSQDAHLKVLVKIPNNYSNVGISLKKLKEHSEKRKMGRAKAVSLHDCFQAFSQPEKLDKNNAWYCPKCKQHVEATKKMEIYKTPTILVIQLKRFRVRGYWREKLNGPVIFPEKELNIAEFVLKEDPGVYELYAITNHAGSLAGGHYIAQCFHPEKEIWVEFNDSHLSETTELSPTAAYMLFYRKSK